VAAVLEALILIPRQGQTARLPPGVTSVGLDVQGVQLVPLTRRVRAAHELSGDDTATVDGFYELSRGVERWARELSGGWVVLYVHLEFFGGEGLQAAVAWDRERVVFGPCFTRTPLESAEPNYQEAARDAMAINAALRALGLPARGGLDEFGTLGLGRHRRTGDWVA
jgi:hypothetical protein